MRTMTYNVYKHISSEQFEMTQARLAVINNIILQRFHDKLKHLHRADDADYLVLNFSFLGQERFLGNLAVMFEDRPEMITFDLTVVKVLDEDGFRYYKKVKMVENITLSYLEQNIDDLCFNAIQTYYSWSEKEVKEISMPL